jgi:superfamily II DNA/RNA helicase
VQALQSKGLSRATDIQGLAYEQIYNGTDVLIGAETGSGKTLAYMLPLIDRYVQNQLTHGDEMHQHPLPAVQGIILAPTNSLCDQIIEMSMFIQDYLKQHSINVQLGIISHLAVITQSHHIFIIRNQSQYGTRLQISKH